MLKSEILLVLQIASAICGTEAANLATDYVGFSM